MVFFFYLLLGFSPFVNIYRMSPVPSFWVQWLMFLFATIFTVFHLVWPSRARQSGKVEISLISICLVALSFILFGQVALQMVVSKINAMFAMMILMVGACFHHAARHGMAPDEKGRLLSWWSGGVAIAFVFQAVASVLLWVGKVWVPFHLLDATVPDRMFGMFGQPNQFGVFEVLALGPLLFLARRRIIKWPIFLASWVVAAVLCAASGSRAALCIWLVLVMVHLIQHFRRNASVNLPRVTHGWGLVGLHALFISIQFIWAMRLAVAPIVTAEVSANRTFRDDGSIGARVEQYRDSLTLFLDQPFFGYGFEKFAQSRVYHLSSSMLEPQSTHTHNLLTNALVDFGLLGGLVVGAACVWVVLGAFKIIFKGDANDEGLNLVSFWALSWLGYSFLEYPFQYVNFFFTFLLMLAYLPVRDLSFDRGKVSVLRLGRALLLSAAILMSVLVAMDYRRLQNMVLGLERQVQDYGLVKTPPSLGELARLRQQSVFVRHVDYYWMKTLGLGSDIADLKIAVARDLFDQTPAGDTLSWYAVNLISGGRSDEALALLCNFGRRSEAEFHVAMVQMHGFASVYGPAEAFLKANQDVLSKKCR